MKTDTIFYRLFQEFPTIFFELIGSSPEQAVGYEFTSQEVKQLAFRMDGLFLPTTNQTDQPFYLVEVQFQPDPSLYYRIFGELFLYLKQYRLPQLMLWVGAKHLRFKLSVKSRFFFANASPLRVYLINLEYAVSI